MSAEHSPGDGPRGGSSGATPPIIWIGGPDGRPAHFNDRWREYTGLSPEAGLGDGWVDAMHPIDRGRRAADWRAAVERGESREFECRLRRADGSHRRHLVRIEPVRDGCGTIVRWIGSMLDIDDRRSGDDELERRAMIAAHDLQEPLRKIEAFGDRLRARHAAGLDDQGREYLGRIVASTARMRATIADALALAKVATTRRPFVPVDLNAAAEEVVSDLDVLIRQTGGRVELGALPTVWADPAQMRRLLQNLIINALKFHRPEAPPLVEVSARAVFVDGEPTPAAIELAVADNGVGFDEADRERIFQPFQRLRGRCEHGGVGLGMAICRRIVERHSGEISATSEPGKGTVFRVVLPVRPGERDGEGSE